MRKIDVLLLHRLAFLRFPVLTAFYFFCFYYFLRAGNTCIPPTPYSITLAIILLFIFLCYPLVFTCFLLYSLFFKILAVRKPNDSLPQRVFLAPPCLCALPARVFSYSYFSISLVNALDRFSSFARWHAAKWSLPMRSNAGAWFSQICLQ